MVSCCQSVKLKALSSSPLSLELRSVVRRPQGLRRVPRRHQDEETYDRTEHSQHKAIIYFVCIHICVCSYVCAECGANDWTKPRIASPTEQSLSRFSSITFLGWIKSYRNSSSVPFGSTGDLSTLALMGVK
jgi:hypothetical protein